MSFWSKVANWLRPARSQPASSTVTAGYLPPPAPNPAPAAPTVITISTSSSAVDYADFHFGYKLEPEKLFAIFREADAGMPLAMLEVFEHIRLVDGHLGGLCNKRLDAVALGEWSWLPQEKDRRPGAEEVAALFDQVMAETNLDEALEHLALEPHEGFAALEVAWIQRSDGLQVPSYLVPVPSRRFVFDRMTFEPRLTDHMHPTGMPLMSTAGSSWVYATSRRWRKPTQGGRLRAASPWSVFKRMSVRDLLIFAAKFGIPIVVGKYGESSGEATRQALVKAVENIGREGSAILDSESTIDVSTSALRSGGGDQVHGTIVNLCNAEISKIYTGGTLTSDNAGGAGSYGLGNVHAQGEHTQTLADARRLSRALGQISREFIARNRLSSRAMPPRFYSAVERDQEAAAREVRTLAQAGLPLSISHNRRRFNQPPPIGDEDTMRPIELQTAQERNANVETDQTR